ncbi:FAD-dependent oxidoreductase [Arthrobacter koreensis]|uniref:FAD-dependent oxidoreductase n=1 Tax=Arthrobacter koreensis TaxID=199136 RepID=UPI002DBB80E2|nr:FAD-dependent oxidoreductase [Arthrobacter koreensis]MEB7503966.1 FAD-dependent oxidoreductase [Arthrobacter koreensis]
MTKSPEFVRQFTRFWLPKGKDVVVIGGSLVGLELAEFFAERGRRVTLLHEKQQLGPPRRLDRGQGRHLPRCEDPPQGHGHPHH